MTQTAPQDGKVPCPGCGGRGYFEWAPTPKVPKSWSPRAVCGMCRGSGKVPSAWVPSKKGR